MGACLKGAASYLSPPSDVRVWSIPDPLFQKEGPLLSLAWKHSVVLQLGRASLITRFML